jgi:hypothetical protein
MAKPGLSIKKTKKDIDFVSDVDLARKIVKIAKNDVAEQIKQFIKNDNLKKISSLEAEIRATKK